MHKTTKVGEIAKNVWERRLKWYGSCGRKRGELRYVGRRVIVMKVQGRGGEEDLGEDGWTK